jgi:glycerol-3-phosphate dehydrogenase (NAD(P)+)
VEITDDLQAAAEDAGMWVFATPSHAVRSAAERLSTLATPQHLLVSVAKGIENDTLMTTTQVLASVLPAVPRRRIAVLYGPSHAEEVSDAVPTAVVAAATTLKTAAEVQSVFMTSRLRVYVNQDVRGVEIGGSVKNVLAIAAGIAEGVGYGDNAKAALITRGMAEIRRLGIAMGADPATFYGLAGIGDLVVTCTSRHSRNRFLGLEIGRGRSLSEVEEEMQMVAEGVRTTRSVHQLAEKYAVEMPISEAVYSILFEELRPEDAVNELMSRSAKHEDWLPHALQDQFKSMLHRSTQRFSQPRSPHGTE